MEISELKSIIEKSGLSAYKIEKDLKIPNGTLGQVLKGKKVLPEKFEEPLRFLAKEVPRDNPLINAARGRDESGVNEDEATLEIEQPEEPVSVNNYSEDPEIGEVDLNEYEKMEADSDKFVGNVLIGDVPYMDSRDAMDEPFPEWKRGIDKQEFEILSIGRFDNPVPDDAPPIKQVKRPLMDIADLL